MALVSIGSAAVLARFFERQLLAHDAELSRQFVQSIVDSQQLRHYFRDSEAPGRIDAFAAFFGHLATMPDVLRANVYGADGRVLWSSTAALIGQRYTDNEELDRALRGELVIERDEVSTGAAAKAEHVALDPKATHFVENYLPVREGAGGSGALVGVVELYRVPRELNATLRSGTLLVWASSLLGGLVVYLSTLGLVRKTSRLMHEQRERLVDAQAMALVGEISASVAHSIRNPLASIRSSAELQHEIGHATPDMAQETIGHVDRIEHLLRTLLSYVNVSTEIQGSADVVATLKAALEHFEPVFRAQDKALELRVDKPLPAVHGGAVLIAQMVNSLLANALEATAANDRIVVSAHRSGKHVQLEVCDSGSGIAPDRLAEVFKPFYTNKPRGLGMGLALVKRTLDRIGGTIELRSEPGRTCAIVLLPIA